MMRVVGPIGRKRAALGQALGAAVLAALCAGLQGCSGDGTIGQAVSAYTDMRDQGENLYHGAEGGAIARERPPPPGSNDPFPNLGTIPARPTPPDIAAEEKLSDELAAQRDAARRAAEANPLPVRTPPPATPKPPAADPAANKVVVDSAAPPPAPAAAAAPAPAAAAAAAQPALPTLASVPAIPAAAANTPLPALAAAPPPAPSGLGDLPTNPAPVAVAEPVRPALPAANVNTVVVDFTYGSATLPPSATLNLRKFALAHKGVPLTVTGHGGDVLPGADAQTRALSLALNRARAIADSLGSAGVPAVNLRLRAEAAGRGGTASL